MDSIIDITQISQENSKIPKLHGKYFRFLLMEKQQLRAFEMLYNQLYKDKYEFYTQGPSKEESKSIKWSDSIKLPAKGLSSTKREIDIYLNSDEEIIKLSLKIGDQKEKIEFLESIIQSLMTRSYLLTNIVTWEKFKAGC